jgi:TRAP-type C4-dicarboxylate transport system permease large subunit
MIPLMDRHGYNREFSTSITITGSTTGLLIPPSNVMIVYSLATGGAVSIAALFMAGYGPGILMGLGLMAVSAVVSIRNNYGKGESFFVSAAMLSLLRALPPQLLIVI